MIWAIWDLIVFMSGIFAGIYIRDWLDEHIL